MLVQNGKKTILPETEATLYVFAGETSDIDNVVFLRPWSKNLVKK